MPQYLTVPIKVTPLVRRFLASQYATDPFIISYDQNPFASYLHACLDRFPRQDVPRRYNRLTAELVVGIPVWQARHGFGKNLSPLKQLAFNDFVRAVFLDRLVTEVRLRSRLADYSHGSIRSAIEAVYATYGITEDELPFEYALRYYTRYRSRFPAAPADFGRLVS